MTAGFISRSHRSIKPFALSRATTIDEAVARMAVGAVPHAGGIDVVERLQAGYQATEIVDIGQLYELQTIEAADDCLRIGAGVTHARIEADPMITEHRPDLAAAWKTVGTVRIRRTGTVGGNLMAFDPTYDAAPILAAAGAELVFSTTDGLVRSAVADRPQGLLLTHIEVPLSGTLRFDRTYKPVTTVAIDKHLAVACAHRELQVHELPTAADAAAADVGARIVQAMAAPLDDAVASGAYRSRLLAVLIDRLLGEAS